MRYSLQARGEGGQLRPDALQAIENDEEIAGPDDASMRSPRGRRSSGREHPRAFPRPGRDAAQALDVVDHVVTPLPGDRRDCP